MTPHNSEEKSGVRLRTPRHHVQKCNANEIGCNTSNNIINIANHICSWAVVVMVGRLNLRRKKSRTKPAKLISTAKRKIMSEVEELRVMAYFSFDTADIPILP